MRKQLREIPRRGISRGKRDDGQAIVEFVLILPIFVGLIFVAIGYGITLNNFIRAGDVAQAGARAASVARLTPGNAAPCVGGNLAGTALAAANSQAGGMAFAQTPSCECRTPSGTIDASCSPGDQIKVTTIIQSQNAIRDIPFMNTVLPDTLTGNATVMLQ
jgi:Flp pilus assembly protein TadG